MRDRQSASRVTCVGALAITLAVGAIGSAAVASAKSPAPAAKGALVRVRTINADASYPEGPLWVHGTLFYTEYGNETIMTWDGKRNRVLWKRNGCGPSGLLETVKGTLLLTCGDNNTLVELTRRGKTIRTIRRDSAGGILEGPNDLTQNPRGGIYFTDSGFNGLQVHGSGTVDYFAPNGSIRRVAGGIRYSNGIGVTPNDKTLLVAESQANRVLSYQIAPDGSLSHRRVFIDLGKIAPAKLGPEDGPDGLKIDAQGTIYIAQNGAGRILIVSPSGKRLLRTVRVSDPHVTNVAMGATSKTLYITSVIDPFDAPYTGAVYEASLG